MNKVKEYAQITLGLFILAISIQFFLVPNNIAAGGISGLAIIINSCFKMIPISAIIFSLDAVLFIIAFIVLGSKFGIKTLYSSVGYAGMIAIFEHFFPQGYTPTNNLILAAIFGALLSGIGLGIIFNANASTGGTDIIAKIINKFFHIEIGKALFSVDLIVIVLSMVIFNVEIGLIALLSVIINGFVIDYVIEGINLCKTVTIISEKSEEIKKYILDELERGCTEIDAKGGYSGIKQTIIYTIVGRRELINLRIYIKNLDPKAFIIVGNSHEVLGEGFKELQ